MHAILQHKSCVLFFDDDVCRYAEEHAKRLNPFAFSKLEGSGTGTPVCFLRMLAPSAFSLR